MFGKTMTGGQHRRCRESQSGCVCVGELGGGVCERREMGRAGGVACLGGRLVGRKGARKMGRGSGWVVCTGARDEGTRTRRRRRRKGRRTAGKLGMKPFQLLLLVDRGVT